MTNSQKLVVFFAAAAAIIGGTLLSLGFFDSKSEKAATGNETVVPAPGTPLIEPEPTDTVLVGAIDAVGKGQGQDELWLVQKKGENVTNTKLILDEQSYCNLGSGGLPCMAMSITFSTAFGGKRALVDGNKQGDSLVVRRLRIMEGDEIPREIPAGSVYLPWARVTDMIHGCETKSMVQTHEGLVQLTTKQGKRYVTVEPVIDEVFKVANQATAQCGSVQLGTE